MKKSFTLIELLVVIFIIGLLATLVLVNLSSARAKSRDAKRKADLDSIRKALEMYNEENAQYPLRATKVLSNSDDWSSAAGKAFEGLAPYIATVPKDPRNVDAAGVNGYLYGYATNSDGTAYKLCTVLEKDTATMANDGGASAGYYEVSSDFTVSISACGF